MVTMELTALGEKILKHWRAHLPQMVAELEKSNRLEEAVQEAQEQTSDLLYELVSVQKMDHQAAWESRVTAQVTAMSSQLATGRRSIGTSTL